MSCHESGNFWKELFLTKNLDGIACELLCCALDGMCHTKHSSLTSASLAMDSHDALQKTINHSLDPICSWCFSDNAIAVTQDISCESLVSFKEKKSR